MDSVGSVDLTPNSSATYSQTGISNNCFLFDSTYSVDDGANIRPTDVFTFSFWYKSGFTNADGTNSNEQYIINNHFSYNGYNVNINYRGYAILIVYDGSGQIAATGTTNLRDESWHFIVAEYDGSDIYIYVDNVQEATTSCTSTIPYTTDCYFYIGSHAHTSYADGYIDEVGYWHRALTSDERSELWNSGSGKFYPF